MVEGLQPSVVSGEQVGRYTVTVEPAAQRIT